MGAWFVNVYTFRVLAREENIENFRNFASSVSLTVKLSWYRFRMSWKIEKCLENVWKICKICNNLRSIGTCVAMKIENCARSMLNLWEKPKISWNRRGCTLIEGARHLWNCRHRGRGRCEGARKSWFTWKSWSLCQSRFKQYLEGAFSILRRL